jgi:hypothetical protein
MALLSRAYYGLGTGQIPKATPPEHAKSQIGQGH